MDRDRCGPGERAGFSPALRCLIRWWRALEPWNALEAAEAWYSTYPLISLRDGVLQRREAVTTADSFGDWTPITVHLNGEISVRARTAPYKGAMFAAYPGDIVFSKIDARNGAIGVLPDEIPKAVVTSEFPVLAPNPGCLDGEFVKLVLRTGNFLSALRSKASGTSGRKRIQPKVFLDLRIPLPPLDKQRAIVAAYRAKLERAADLEREAREIEARAMGAFEAALGFETPVPLPDRPVFAASFKDLDRWGHEGVLRESTRVDTVRVSPFTVVQLREVIADLVVGWSPRCLNRSADINEWGVLKLSAVTSGRLQPSENKALPPRVEPRPELEVRCGDVLITRGSGITRLVGAAIFVEDEPPSKLMICDLVFRVEFKEIGKIDPAFLAATFGTAYLRNQIEADRTGAAPMMQKITKTALMSIKLPLPPISQQVAMVGQLNTARATAANIRTEARNTCANAWDDFEVAICLAQNDSEFGDP